MSTKTEEISETKQHILNMAEQLFALRGFEGVSMREIAEACDITKANIYYYFKDKESLYLEVLENDLLEMIAALRLASRAEGTCRVRMARIVTSIARLSDEKRPLIQMGMRHFSGTITEVRDIFRRHRRQLSESIERVLADGVASGELRPLDVRLTAASFMGLIFVHVIKRDETGLAFLAYEELTRHTVDLLFDGIEARA
jgi:TetR/AcrR family transcriptional regulator, cholesterol catabolism regulator